jgi:hypothetical protein
MYTCMHSRTVNSCFKLDIEKESVFSWYCMLFLNRNVEGIAFGDVEGIAFSGYNICDIYNTHTIEHL